jgi:hypothetical protein
MQRDAAHSRCQAWLRVGIISSAPGCPPAMLMLLLFANGAACRHHQHTAVLAEDYQRHAAAFCARAAAPHLAARVGGLVPRAGDDDERLGFQGFERRGRPQRRLRRRDARAQLRAHLRDRCLNGAAGLCRAGTDLSAKELRPSLARQFLRPSTYAMCQISAFADPLVLAATCRSAG